MLGLMPSLTQETWTYIFQVLVAVIIAAFVPRLMTSLYHLLREYID